MRVNSGRLLVILSTGLFFASVTQAWAQADHLRCFKAKDGAKFDATAVLSALQTQFGVDETCSIKGKGKLFCVPVTKSVTNFEDKSKDGIPQVAFTGQTLENDRLCYKIKCPNVEIGPEVVTDQFGTRTIEKFKSQFLCTPAVKGVVTTTTTTSTTTTTAAPVACGRQGLQCGGACPNGGTCVEDPLVFNGCQCTPSECDLVDLIDLRSCVGSCGTSGGDCRCGTGGFCNAFSCIEEGDCAPGGYQCLNSVCVGPSCSADSDCSYGVCDCGAGDCICQ